MYFYYNSATGNIIGGTGYGISRNDAGITHIPAGADSFAWFEDDETVWQTSYDYKIQGGQLVHDPIPDAVKLEEAKAAKKTFLHDSLQGSIGSFTSAALGSTHTYLADASSMMLLGSNYSYVRGTDVTPNYTVKWYTVEEGRVVHSAAQIAQVYLDGHTFIQSQYDRYADLEAQVDAVGLDSQTLQQALDQLNAITW